MTHLDPFASRIDAAIHTALAGGQAEAIESLRGTAAVADALAQFIASRGLADDLVEYVLRQDLACVDLVQQLVARLR